MEKLSEFFVSPGFCEEKMWLFLATDLTETSQRLEDDEAIEVVRMPLSRALQMITDGEIEDAKTIIGLMLAALVVSVAGHFGGSLTHGDGYLTELLFNHEEKQPVDRQVVADGSPAAVPARHTREDAGVVAVERQKENVGERQYS